MTESILQELRPMQWSVPVPTLLTPTAPMFIPASVLPKREAALAVWPKRNTVTADQATPLIQYSALLVLLAEHHPSVSSELAHVLHAIAYIEDNVACNSLVDQTTHAFSCARSLYHAIQSDTSKATLPFGVEEVSLKLTHAKVLALFCDQSTTARPAVYTLAASIWDKSLLSYKNSLTTLYGQVASATWRAYALSEIGNGINIDTATDNADDIIKKQVQKKIYATAANEAIRSPFLHMVSWSDPKTKITALTSYLHRVSARFNALAERETGTLVTYQNKGGYYIPGSLDIRTLPETIPQLPETLSISNMSSPTEEKYHGVFDNRFLIELVQARLSYAGQAIAEKADMSVASSTPSSTVNVIARLLGQSDSALLDEMKIFPNVASTQWQQGLIVGVLVERLSNGKQDLDVMRDAGKLRQVLKQLCPSVGGQFVTV